MQEGFINLCSDYGCVKSIELHKNKAFIEFDNEKYVSNFTIKLIKLKYVYCLCNDYETTLLLLFFIKLHVPFVTIIGNFQRGILCWF